VASFFSLETLIPQARKVDLTQLGFDFGVPILFFEGRHDPYARPSLIWSYYEMVGAPRKEFIWFDNSGHFPFFEEKQKFADYLIDTSDGFEETRKRTMEVHKELLKLAGEGK